MSFATGGIVIVQENDVNVFSEVVLALFIGRDFYIGEDFLNIIWGGGVLVGKASGARWGGP